MRALKEKLFCHEKKLKIILNKAIITKSMINGLKKFIRDQ